MCFDAVGRDIQRVVILFHLSSNILFQHCLISEHSVVNCEINAVCDDFHVSAV